MSTSTTTLASGVIIDLIDGASGSHHLIHGWAFNRLAIITGLQPLWDGNQDTGQLLYDAVAELVKVTGDRGTPYPGFPVPTYLEQFMPESVTSEEVRIRVLYKGYPAGQVEFCTSLNQVESNTDASGNVISVSYTYPTDYWNKNFAGKTITQGGMITRPMPEITYTVRLTVTGGVYEVTTLVVLAGKVNKDAYVVGVIPGAPRTWMISDVRAISRDGGNVFELSLSMQYREQGWDPLTLFINPDDGKPPHDLVDGVGYKNPKSPDETTFPSFEFTPN